MTRTETATSVNPADLVSVIVPVSERPESLVELYREFSAPFRETGERFEFVFIVEPWARNYTEPLAALTAAGEPVRVLEAGQTVGETMLLRAGVGHCRGDIVVTLPAYRRVLAEALPEMVQRVRAGADLVVARRWPRRDPWINRLQNRVFHRMIRGLASGRINDVASGVRAMRREVLQQLPIYGDFFRFLPLFAIREGYRVEEIASPQHPADRQPRVYGPGVYLRRIIDLLGLFFLLRFTEKPLRFFGLIGSVLSISGGLLLAFLLVERLSGQGIAERPLLLLGVLLLVLGVQAIALGLVGEIIVHLRAPDRRPYRLAEAAPPIPTQEVLVTTAEPSIVSPTARLGSRPSG